MTFRVLYKTDKILHLVFSTREEMCRTMLRFAEHYESPEFRNKIFTLEEFKTWYSKGGEFTYYTDWGGYNIPGYIFEPFKKGLFKDMTESEQTVLSILPNTTEFYLIATDESYSALKHELAHALYYLNPEYAETVKGILTNAPNIEVPFEALKKLGYCEEVLLDEVQAYLVDDMKKFNYHTKVSRKLGWIAWFKYWLLSKKLNKVFNKTLARYH
jgi:hypothetical protein